MIEQLIKSYNNNKVQVSKNRGLIMYAHNMNKLLNGEDPLPGPEQPIYVGILNINEEIWKINCHARKGEKMGYFTCELEFLEEAIITKNEKQNGTRK